MKGNITGLTHPQLVRHVEAAISISVDAIKARFGGLVKDEGIQTTLDSFRVLNPDTWPEEQANLLTFGDDSVANLVRRFEKPQGKNLFDKTLHYHLRHLLHMCKLSCSVLSFRAGYHIATIQDEWQGIKILVSQNFRDKTYTGLWEILLTNDPYKQDYKVRQSSPK